MVGVRGFEPPAPCSQSRCATGLRYTPMLRGETGRSISPEQQRSGGPGSHAAVTDAVLVGGGRDAERAAEGWIEEERVVAEAARPVRRLRDAALHGALDEALATAGLHERDDTAVARRAALGRHAAQAFEEERVAALVVEFR